MGARLQKYLFTHNQLQTYLQIFTGQNDVVVLADSQPQTHVPSKVVGLPIGTPHAATSASHEGLHIIASTHEAMAAMKNAAERAVLNVLDDGRIERNSFRTLPGLRPQFQEDIDDLTNIILKEGWLSQALKGMYLKSVGYDFPYDKLHPKAQNILGKFAGFVPIVRKAESDMDLVPLVPRVLALFDEPLEMPEPPPPMPGGNGEQGEEEDEEWGESGDEDEDGEGDDSEDADGESADSDDGEQQPSKGKSAPKGKPGKGIKGKDPGKALKGADDSEPDRPEPTEAEKAMAERMRKGMEKSQTQAEKVKRQHGPVIMSEDGDDLDDEDIYEREGVEYDADEARNRAQAAERLGVKERKGKGKGGRENVIGGDRVTGGPTVNQLMLQAEKVKKDLDALEAKRKRNSLSALTRARNADEDTGYKPGAGYVPYVPQSIEEDKSEDGVKRARVPKAMRDVTALPQALDALSKAGSDPYGYYRGPSVNIPIDWGALLGAEHGGTGYHGGSGWNMQDLREPVFGHQAVGVESAKKFAATSNYLARQLRVFMQTDNRKGMRSYERMGLLDPRRSYHMGAGRFDVFRNPPNHSDSSPVVCMTTDISGSMGGNLNSPAFHAMNASIVLAQALHKLRIPFEAHSFDSQGGFLKGFNDPMGYRTIGGLSNLMSARGGTSAAEALAVAWVRLLSRPEPRKIVFLVSDGGVAQNTLAMAQAIEAAGGICVGVGIGLGHIGKYFPHSVEVQHASELPAVFARLLRKLLPTGQWAA